jgi:hypothetical protein
VPVALLTAVGVAWLLRRLEARAVVTVYEPPPGMLAGEAGVVIDGREDPADVVAAVIDLAARDYLSLEPIATPAGTDILVSVRRPWLHDRAIRPFEAVLLAHVFERPGVYSVPLSVLRGQSYPPTSVKETLSNDLEDRGYFGAAPRAVRRAGRWAALFVLAVWVQLSWNAGAPASTYVAGLVSAAAVWLLAAVVAANGLTAAGRRARHQLHGFRAFLRRVEKERLEQLHWGTLDPHLPWAIALGVTEAWIAAGPPEVRTDN